MITLIILISVRLCGHLYMREEPCTRFISELSQISYLFK